MKNLSSISLLIMGIGLLPIAYYTNNVFLKCVFALASIILSIVAAVRSFKEKNENQL